MEIFNGISEDNVTSEALDGYMLNFLVGCIDPTFDPKSRAIIIKDAYEQNPHIFPRIDQENAFDQMLAFIAPGNRKAFARVNQLLTDEYNRQYAEFDSDA
ncbi:MAG: hypothetical protein Q4C49_00555 [Bacillota bacterium]|nr:hypothetical protein [Bacillota bacterium]